MTTIDLHLPDEQAARLDRYASSVRKTIGEATAQLIDEVLRHEEFPFVEFRVSIVDRQAYAVGSGLAVWEVIMVAEAYQFNLEKTAEHLSWPVEQVQGVIAYYRAYPDDIDRTLRENDELTEDDLRLRLPYQFRSH